jgi:hypothetical protein
MHFDNSKANTEHRDGDGVRSKKKRAGGSDPTLCGYPAAQTLTGSGVATARAFSGNATLLPALAESGSEADLN